MTTTLTYFENTYQFESTARLIEIQINPEGKTTLILDQTIFYPQGGGQPYDIGTISNTNGLFRVSEVRMKEGIVHHIGTFEKGTFTNGETVDLKIDEARRRLHARLHSAGHLLDVAVESLGKKWVAGKGYHFPEGSYVEYEGEMKPEEIEPFRHQLEEKTNHLLHGNTIVKKQIVEKGKVHELCGTTPDYLPDGKPVRIITFSGSKGCPCGGTHVENTKEIGSVRITKITSKKGTIRVSYTLE
jgi:Ser-tRNA(Ala) deacylase AlaX